MVCFLLLYAVLNVVLAEVPSNYSATREITGNSSYDSEDSFAKETPEDILTGIIVGCILGGLVVTIVIIYIFCICCRTETHMSSEPASQDPEEMRRSLSTTSRGAVTAKVCRNGHVLSFVRGKNLPGQYQICNVCGSKYSLSQRSWHCATCNFDICSTCRILNPVYGTKYPSCSRGHPLVLSRYFSPRPDGPYHSGTYVCNACAQHKPCSIARFFCAFCLVNVCPQCQGYVDNKV